MKENVSLLDLIEKSYLRFFKHRRKKLIFDLALSGGQDSMALLYLLSKLSKSYNFKLRAIHIHHGISPNADLWLDLCEKNCNLLKVEFLFHKVKMQENHPLGIEGQARELRYSALNKSKKGILVCAHHQEDQVETFFLQLIRGSGLRGLSSMPEFDEKRLLWRPLLAVNQDNVKDYISKNNIKFVTDESNFDNRFDRNFLRRDLLPRLLKRFPHAIKTINRSIDLIAEGHNLNQKIAANDFKEYLCDDNKSLNLAAFNNLETERLINLLRWWLNLNEIKMPNQKTTNEILNQVKNKKKDALIKIKITENISIRTYQNVLCLVEANEDEDFEFTWKGEEFITLPNKSKLFFIKRKGQGFSLDKIASGKLVVRNRRGGEKFKPKTNQPTRSLKTLLQSSKIPPWKRASIPLVVNGDSIVAIPEFGIDCSYKTNVNKYGYCIEWSK